MAVIQAIVTAYVVIVIGGLAVVITILLATLVKLERMDRGTRGREAEVREPEVIPELWGMQR